MGSPSLSLPPLSPGFAGERGWGAGGCYVSCARQSPPPAPPPPRLCGREALGGRGRLRFARNAEPTPSPPTPLPRIGERGERQETRVIVVTTTKPVHAAYIHIPFCAHHCGYCDFAIATGQDHLIELYLDALAIELSRLGDPHPVRTLFLGGGTPTYLSADQLRRLLVGVLRWLPPESGHEFSVEANPGTLD